MTPTYYELLGLSRTASFDDVKRAFRREIARYHPDKVQHLGPEFEEIAASKAAILTQAYKTLGDPTARAAYDAGISAGTPLPEPPHPPTTDHAKPVGSSNERPTASRSAETRTPAAPGKTASGSDDTGDVVRRATVLRFRHALETEFGPHDQSVVTGFDVACAPSTRGLFAKKPPRVLGRIVPQVDAAA